MALHDDIDHSGLTGVGDALPQPLDTTDAPEFAEVNVGHPTDTTLTRVSAGVIAVEGTNLVKAGAVTGSGLTQATARLLGRTTASTGAIEEISVGSGLSLSAGSLSATGSSGALDDLTDVDAPTPADGDVLTFDSGSGDWIAAAPTGGGGSGVGDKVFLFQNYR